MSPLALAPAILLRAVVVAVLWRLSQQKPPPQLPKRQFCHSDFLASGKIVTRMASS